MIHLALTHDWELRGDGSGDIEQIQFVPMRRLLGIYKKFGVRTTFMPDVLQQIMFRLFETELPDLKKHADTWDAHALAAYRQGHDIQLHLHSQWSGARIWDGKWFLDGSWSLLTYAPERAKSLISQCKQYLERLICAGDPNYRCVAFRASALALAPSPHLLSSLVDLGIEIDVSMAAGFYLNNETLQLDYRECDEDFLPYYPKMGDARRVSDRREPIVCVPLNHFFGSRREVTRQNMALVKARFVGNAVTGGAVAPAPARLDTRTKGVARVYEKLIAPAVKRKYFVSDLSRLNYPLMVEMLSSIRQRARKTGLSQTPVVLTNHPKDIRDWEGLERFVGELAEAADIKFITLSGLAEKLKTGEFQPRTTS